jgi:pentatricopeptide repeat protein
MSVVASTTTDGNLVVDDTWEIYQELMEAVMKRSRVTKKQKPEDLTKVHDYLLSNRPWMESTLSVTDTDGNFRDAAFMQRQKFMNATGFSNQQYEHLTRCLSYAGDISARTQSPASTSVAWYKVKECGLIPRENTVSTYMYALSLSEESAESCLEVATIHDLLFDPNEKTTTLRIKSLVAKGDAAGAEHLLSSLPDKGKSAEWKKLRTFVPILSHHCETGDMGAALRLFRQMRESDGVIFDAEIYALLIGSLARCGLFRSEAAAIDILEHGFSVASGPELFDQLASEMSEDLLELTENATKVIADGLIEGHGQQANRADWTEIGAVSGVKKIGNELCIGRVSVNSTTAVCPETGATLRLFTLTEELRLHVHDTLLEMAAAQHEEYGEQLRAQGKKEQRDGQYAFEQLSNFSDWLRDREGNVHYSQVQCIVQELEKMGERPLVVMPQKYMSPRFWISGLSFTQELSQIDLDIIESLKAEGKVYTVPSSCLDDYYWMLASVVNQGVAFSSVLGESQLPGLRPLLITNDQMRDHRLSLLEPRLFRRWTSSHIVNYDIRTRDDDESDIYKVRLYPALLFSREIQGNTATLYGQRMAWHFPVTEWPDPERFCVSILS